MRSGVGLAFAPQKRQFKQTYLSHRLRGDPALVASLYSVPKAAEETGEFGVSGWSKTRAASPYSKSSRHRERATWSRKPWRAKPISWVTMMKRVPASARSRHDVEHFCGELRIRALVGPSAEEGAERAAKGGARGRWRRAARPPDSWAGRLAGSLQTEARGSSQARSSASSGWRHEPPARSATFSKAVM